MSELTKLELEVESIDPEEGSFYDWIIVEGNKRWHELFFAKAALVDHQAKGNCSLAWCVIEYMEESGWLSPGDVVLDPMCGIGSFLIVAALKGYNAIGVELEQRFVDDMVGGKEAKNDDDDLFSGFYTHVEGVLERFASVSRGMKNIGSITVFQGDARRLDKIVTDVEINNVLCSPPYSATVEKGGVPNPKHSGQKQHVYTSGNIGNTRILTSPPYGNRLTDVAQQFGGKDQRTWDELNAERVASKNAQYSQDAMNIGNAKVTILTSPPYSRGTEHSKAQIAAISKEDSVSHGHKPHQYTHRSNIAVLKNSKYSREMLKVYTAMHRTLEKGSVVALITRDFIQKGKVVELYRLTRRLMERAGFTLLDLKRAKLPELSFFKHINYQKYHQKRGLPMINWEDVQFFMKKEG